jgi:hypothetical protein
LVSVLLYVILVLVFTGVAQLVSSPSSQTGTFRSLATIPGHVLLIFAFGLALGMVASTIEWRFDLTLVSLVPSFAILIDVDHLPSSLGSLQPIRPAHSFLFVLLASLILYLTIRRPDVSLAAVSGFAAHMAFDSGVFPPFSPLSFAYYNLGDFRLYFGVTAVGFALLAGLLAKNRAPSRGPSIAPGQTPTVLEYGNQS